MVRCGPQLSQCLLRFRQPLCPIHYAKYFLHECSRMTVVIRASGCLLLLISTHFFYPTRLLSYTSLPNHRCAADPRALRPAPVSDDPGSAAPT